MTGMPVYFADPGCPGQRGTNENSTGLIREFFPKGTVFKNISRIELKQVEKLLNQRPIEAALRKSKKNGCLVL